jgi:hypothetical protein
MTLRSTQDFYFDRPSGHYFYLLTGQRWARGSIKALFDEAQIKKIQASWRPDIQISKRASSLPREAREALVGITRRMRGAP